MDMTLVFIAGLAGMVFLMVLGMPLAFSAILMTLVGLWFVQGSDAALVTVGHGLYSSASKYTFTVVPLFILMGHFISTAGFAQDLFWMSRQWVGRLPGGLASAVCVGGAGLGAACGSSTASAAILTKVALPELERSNYDIKLASGCIAAAGTLAVTIPPSVLIIIYGLMTEQSVGKLLIAGIIPGILTAGLFVVQITLRAWRNPALGPPVHGVTWTQRLVSLKGAWGISLVAILVLGGIYTGIFTPTEAGSIGAVGTLIIALAKRRLTRKNLWESLTDTGRSVCMIFIVVSGMLIFTRLMAITRVTYTVSEIVTGLPAHPLVILAVILSIYLVLGCFLDSWGMLVLTLPIIFPASQALGFDPIWFGIIVVIMVEVGLLTPPVGMNIFMVRGAAPHLRTEDIFRGALPFFLSMILVIVLLIAFPQIVLFLPNLMR